MVKDLEEAKRVLAETIADLKQKHFKRDIEISIEKLREQLLVRLLPLFEKGQMSRDEFIAAIRSVKITVPDIKLPSITLKPEIHVPEIKLPDITIPEITVPPVKVPKSAVTVNMPTKALTNEIRAVRRAISEQKPVTDRFEIPEYTRNKPIPAILVDELGKPWSPLTGASRAIANMIRNDGNLIAGFGSGTSETALRVVNATDFATSVSVSGFTSSVATVPTNAAGLEYDSDNPAPVTFSGSVEVKQVSGFIDSVNVVSFATGTATLTDVTSSTTSVTIIASNSSRKGAMIYNDSNRSLYIKLGGTASSTSGSSPAFTTRLLAGSYYELPQHPIYTGVIDGIWDTDSGWARVTEMT